MAEHQCGIKGFDMATGDDYSATVVMLVRQIAGSMQIPREVLECLQTETYSSHEFHKRDQFGWKV